MKTLFCALILLASTTQADNTAPESLLKDAQALYNQRENLTKVEDTIQLLTQNDASVEGAADELKFQLRTLLGTALYHRGYKSSDRAEKMSYLEKAMAQHKLAAKTKDVAEAQYNYAAALGRWAEAKGIVESLSRKGELMDSLNAAIARKSLSGAAGESVESYGPRRILGRMYQKLPFFAGGSRTKALENLNKAYQNAPNFPLNVIYRAEVLGSGNSAEKKEACSSLETLLKNDPKTLDPARIPENIEEFAEAKTLQSQLCN